MYSSFDFGSQQHENPEDTFQTEKSNGWTYAVFSLQNFPKVAEWKNG
jgi:hypothetical protein